MAAMKHRVAGHSKHRGIAGTAAIEFGLSIPLLVIIVMGVAELGFAMYGKMQVYNSVEAGALYAAKNGFDSAGITAAVVNATGTQGITATPAPVQFCGCPSATGIVADRLQRHLQRRKSVRPICPHQRGAAASDHPALSGAWAAGRR